MEIIRLFEIYEAFGECVYILSCANCDVNVFGVLRNIKDEKYCGRSGCLVCFRFFTPADGSFILLFSVQFVYFNY